MKAAVDLIFAVYVIVYEFTEISAMKNILVYIMVISTAITILACFDLGILREDSIIQPDVIPPKVISSEPEHGTIDLDPEHVNTDGMMIKFSEPLKEFNVEVTINGEALKWYPKLSDDKKTVNLVMLKGGELPYAVKVVLIWTVEDMAGNKAEGEIIFTTKLQEDCLRLKELIGYWAFDDLKGDIASDSSKQGNDGKIIGDVKWEDGRYGSALEFNGDGMVTIPDSKAFDITQSITITAWIKPDQVKGDIVSKEGAYSMAIEDGFVKWVIGDDEFLAKANIQTHKMWHHIALVYDSDAQRRLVYLDGYPISKKETKIPIPLSDKPLIIGNGFKGRIDEISLWNRALDIGEIGRQMDGLIPSPLCKW